MQKRLTALFALASALLVSAPLQAHAKAHHAKPVHAKHAQQKQAHARRAHTKHSQLAATKHKAVGRHHHQTHLAAATRMAHVDVQTALDSIVLKPDTALTLSGSQYLTAHDAASTHTVPAWLGHTPSFDAAQMMAQADVPTYFGKFGNSVTETRISASSKTSVAISDQDVSAAVGSGDNAAVRQALIAFAMQLRDIRYVRGGHDPATGFDCSGFVRYVFAHAIGMQLPTNSASQFLAGLRVKRADMKPCDLVFFHTHGKRRISHVGIYISDGRFIHSPTSGKSVQISSLDEDYWARHFAGAKRPQAIAMAARG
jgi:cell wall-associated NlpC family hydrolase